jgi:hypothetical protein
MRIFHTLKMIVQPNQSTVLLWFILITVPFIGLAQVGRLTVGDLWETYDGLESPLGLQGLYMVWPGGQEQGNSLYEGGFRTNSTGAKFRLMFRDWETIAYDSNQVPIDTNIVENYHPSYALKEPNVAYLPRVDKWMRTYKGPTTVITQDGVVHQNLVEQQSRNVIVWDGLISDEMVEYTEFYAHGFIVKSKYYAWANPFHDDYVIRVVEILNNGNTDDDEYLVDPDDQPIDLHNLYIDYFVNNLTPNNKGEGYYSWDATGTWDNWHDYYGDQPGDSLRYMFAFDGDDPSVPGDDQGDPFPPQFADDGSLNYKYLYEAGEFVSAMAAGYGVLYVSSNDRPRAPNDPSQPFTYNYGDFTNAGGWREGHRWQNIYNAGETAFNHPDYNQAVPKSLEACWMGFGPFELSAWGSLTLVFAHAVNGPSVESIRDVSQAYLNGEITQAQKNTFLAQSRDSLAQTMARAQWNWDNYLSKKRSLPNAPQPPTNLEISSGLRAVSLVWDLSASEDVAEYRIYRKAGNNLGDFDFVGSVESSESMFIDSTVNLGVSYYYYVTAANDGSTNTDPTCLGQPLESSKFFNRSYHAVSAYRPASLTLNETLVIPNPYHLNQVSAWEGEVNKLMFTNLSERCTIRIFTINGDLVKTMHKDNQSAYIYWSPMLTDDNLLIAPDIYIYHVTDTDTGETGYGKFVVVR